MTTTRQRMKFIEQVAEAARTPRKGKPRGRPMPQNLTEEGRRMGLQAAWAAPRCRAKRSDGEACQRAAMRGATRCWQHGGRREVPDHPRVIERFINGGFHEAERRRQEYIQGREIWQSMSPRHRREMIDALPPEVAEIDARLFRAALVWDLADRLPAGEWRRRWQEVAKLPPVWRRGG